MSREIYTQAANPNPYAPQPSYAGSPPFQAPQDPYESSLPLHQQYRYTPEPQSEHHQSPPEKQHSMNVQHPQATYQQQPGPMSYNVSFLYASFCIPSQISDRILAPRTQKRGPLLLRDITRATMEHNHLLNRFSRDMAQATTEHSQLLSRECTPALLPAASH